MHKSMALGCTALLLLTATNALSALTLSSSAAPTVSDYLEACGNDKYTCANMVGSVLIDKFNRPHIARICVSSPDYTEAVVPWLAAHPETSGLAMEDGIFLALKALYVC